MKVKDLMKKLALMDKNAPVSVRHTTDGEWGQFQARSIATGAVKRKHGVMITCRAYFIETGVIP